MGELFLFDSIQQFQRQYCIPKPIQSVMPTVCVHTPLIADCSPILTVQPGHCDWVIHQSCWQLRDDVIYKSLVQCFLLEWLRRLMLSGPSPVWQIVCTQITKWIAQDLIELNKINISCSMMHIARLVTFTLFGCKTMM